MTGIGTALQALDRGFRVRVFERSDDIGGTWSINTYPGVGVDTPATYYSLSYELNPAWRQHYPTGREYYDYLCGVVEKHGLRRHIRFATEVLKTVWDDEAQEWVITTLVDGRDVETVRAGAVISAMGPFQRPVYPDIPGARRSGAT